MTHETKECEYCKQMFEAKRVFQKYCSESCRMIAWHLSKKEETK